MTVNRTTAELPPYPMEELAKIRRKLTERGTPIYDFGTGDPNIPTWEPIRQALIDSVPEVSSYPSVRGIDRLRDAICGYLDRRFELEVNDDLGFAPTRGSKEAIFHTALSIVGRAGGKRHVIYPDPGYPVYRSSTLFAGGIPAPVQLTPANNYLLEPWNLPRHLQSDAAAVWVNYPHNPTGATVESDYWEKLISWGQDTDTLILSDDCYVDIYSEIPPAIPIQFETKNVLSFLSLSKRSGLTGYRSGCVAGDPDLIAKLQRARANMGVSSPVFVQEAAATAWEDDDHVVERRKIFSERMALLAPFFQEKGLLEHIPVATFYLWVRIPERFKNNDLKFCLNLAERGVIASPSQWLSEGIKGYARFALVPGLEETQEAMQIIEDFIEGQGSRKSATNEAEDYDEEIDDEGEGEDVADGEDDGGEDE